jgi:hypothetical protein
MSSEEIFCLWSEEKEDVFWVAYSTINAERLRQEQKQLEERSFIGEIPSPTPFWIKIEIKKEGKLRVTDVDAPKRRDKGGKYKFIGTLPLIARDGLVRKVGRAQVGDRRFYDKYLCQSRFDAKTADRYASWGSLKQRERG